MRASAASLLRPLVSNLWRVLAMTPTSGSLSHPITLDYENTLVLAIELSKASWVLAAQVPGLPRIKAKQTVEPRTEALLAAIDGYRARSRAAGRPIERVVAIYEAGWSGFWLARWLVRHGVETHAVQPSSVPVDRRVRRPSGQPQTPIIRVPDATQNHVKRPLSDRKAVRLIYDPGSCP